MSVGIQGKPQRGSATEWPCLHERAMVFRQTVPHGGGSIDVSASIWRSTTDLVHDCSLPSWFSALTDSDGDATEKSRRVGSFAEEFCATKDWGEAVSLATKGWPEGRERATGLADVIEAGVGPRLSPVFVRHYDVAGSEPDVQAYLAGEPEHMIDFRIEEGRVAGRVVRIVVDVAASGNVTSNVLLARAAAVLALTESVVRGGDAVELWIVDTNSCRGGNTRKMALWAVKVQAAGDPVDMDALAFWCGHPSVLRRFQFASMERESKEYCTTFGVPNGGYGCCTHTLGSSKALIDSVLGGEAGEVDLYIPGINHGIQLPGEDGRPTRAVDYSKPIDQVDWVRHQMRQAGFEVTAHVNKGVM